MTSSEKILNVPTNIITGFLGSGKTTAILHLLKSKPANEKWAILVNEFGEIGVDGSLISGQNNDQQVFIREVPGGCMCCAAGLPMQAALNELLSRAKPDRLLIEPTGLGHPREVLSVLSGKHYHESLSIQNTITLVDARKLTDPRYTSHETFNQQIAIADIVIGNKADLYTGNEPALLQSYVADHGTAHALIAITEQGKLSLNLLNRTNHSQSSCHEHEHEHHHHHSKPAVINDAPIPECGYLKVENSGEGFSSSGWRFANDQVFNRQQLVDFLQSLQIERLKATLLTNHGWFSYNQTADGLSEVSITTCPEGRIEIIADKIDQHWQSALLNCLI